MTKFCPPGFRFLDDMRSELGHDSLKSKLMAGELTAYFWNAQSRWEPLQRIPASDWWKAHTDAILENGMAWDFDEHVVSGCGFPILIDAPEHLAPAKNASRQPAAVSPAKLRQFVLAQADGTRPQPEVRAAAMADFGRIPDRLWRHVWRDVPQEQKLPRGRRKQIR